jgi:hypothetical protein
MGTSLMRKFFCVVIAIFVLPHVCQAGIVIGNLTGNYFSGYNLGPAGVGLNNSIATGFTMTSDYALSDVKLELQTTSGTLALALYDNDASNNPGNVLVTFTNPSFVAGSTATYTFTPNSSFTLLSGHTYWLDLYSTGTGSQYDLWVLSYTPSFANAQPSGVGATYVGYKKSLTGNPPTTTINDHNYVAYQLDGSPSISAVPEPSTLVIWSLMAGVFGVGRLRRRFTKTEGSGRATHD